MLQQELRLIPEKETPLCCLNEKKEKGKRGKYNHLNFKDSNLSKLPSLLLERNGEEKAHFFRSQIEKVSGWDNPLNNPNKDCGAGRGGELLSSRFSPSLGINVLPQAGE